MISRRLKDIMSSPSLHSIQERLIALLTNPDAFDPEYPAMAAMGNEIGPDVSRISLYGKLSHLKRMSKIEGVLARTIVHLGEPYQPLTRPFLAAYPPFSANRYENARQFFDFLVRRWGGRPQDRPYLLDLARYELAVADARTQPWEKSANRAAGNGATRLVRRAPSVSLIRCKYDVRPLLEQDDVADPPAERALFLAIVFPIGASSHRVFEIEANLANLLAGLTEWQPSDSIKGALDQLLQLDLVELQ